MGRTLANTSTNETITINNRFATNLGPVTKQSPEDPFADVVGGIRVDKMERETLYLVRFEDGSYAELPASTVVGLVAR